MALHAAYGRPALLRSREIGQSTAARTIGCALCTATGDSQSLPRPQLPQARCGPARGATARYTAAHPARHTCIAFHLAETPHAPPRLDSEAGVSDWALALAGTRAWRAWGRRDSDEGERAWTTQARRVHPTQVHRLGCDAPYAPLQSAASPTRARTPRAHA